jgi:hypothetical protein
VTVVADSHHLIKVGESVAKPALFVVDLLALARAGPGCIDFTSPSRALVYSVSNLVVGPSTGRTFAAHWRDSRASQGHPLEELGLLPRRQLVGFSERVTLADCRIKSDDLLSSFLAFSSSLSHLFIATLPPLCVQP